MYSLTSSMFKTALPNMGQVIKQNPDLVKNMMSAVQNTMANNAVAQQQPGGQADDGSYEMRGPGIDLSSLMGNIMMPPPPPMSTSVIQAPAYNPQPEIEDDVSDIVSEKAEEEDEEVRDIEVKTKTTRKRGGSRKKKTEINL